MKRTRGFGFVAALSCTGVWACAVGCGSRTSLDLLDGTGSSSGGSSGSPGGAGSSSGSGGGSSNGSSSGALPPSCALGGAGLTDCGATRESCCTSLEVTGGAFHRTYTNSGNGPTGEADSATVSGFRLDKYLVTVGRYRQFMKAWNDGAGYWPPPGSGKHTHLNGGDGLANAGSYGSYEPGWVASDNPNVLPMTFPCDPYFATWTASAGTQENLPINCVNWYDAYAFCIWDGGFLPSEAEWEYAAAGGAEEREYPWGSADPGTSNEYAIYDCHYPSGSPTSSAWGSCSGVSSMAPVGTSTKGPGRWGQLDLVGNLFEWVLDRFNQTPYAEPCSNCGDLPGDSREGNLYRGSRGGAHYTTKSFLLPPSRSGAVPATPFANTGFRCARTPR